MGRTLLIALLSLFVACQDNGRPVMPSGGDSPTNTTPTNTTTTPGGKASTVIPGETITITKMQITKSHLVDVTIKNNTALDVPMLHVDYNIICDSGRKEFSAMSFALEPNEELLHTLYVDSDTGSSCTLTLTTIHCSAYRCGSFAPWEGKYTVSTDMF